MPCYVEPPTHTQEEWLGYMLCQACRFLTKGQIQSIGPLDIYQDLMQWYTEHLLEDFQKNYEDITEREKYQREAMRLGIILNKEETGCFSAKRDGRYKTVI